VITLDHRVDVSKKGSVLFFSKIELKWNAFGVLTQDTILTIINDYPEDVFVQWYFINGDAPKVAEFAGIPPVVVERAHSGWNWVDCTTQLTEHESTYMSAATDNPLGCQPFRILDPSRTPFSISDPRTYPGRPDPDGTGLRVLRGYAIAFAVDSQGREISWNHLSGSVDIVNYSDRSAWEYNAFAFQCKASSTPGQPCGTDNTLDLDGSEYDSVFDKLLFDFYAVGSQAFSQGLNVVTLDTDLTLYPVDVDLRQDNDGPVTTKAKFDIWNQNEDGFSGTTRCITCWDQTLLSNYGSPNNFLIGNLHTDKGKARIDGVQSDVCDSSGSACSPAGDQPTIRPVRSRGAALLGVSDKILTFSGAVTGRTDAGMTLVGQGTQLAAIKRDIPDPPEPFTTGIQGQLAPVQVDIETLVITPRTSSRGQRTGKE